MVLFAKDIVEKDFPSLPRGTIAFEAAKQMKLGKHGFVVIATAEGKPEGIVTEWDYLSKLVAEGKDPSKVTLGDIMSPNLITVEASDGIDYVAKLMAEKGIRRVLVVQDGRVIGTITSRTMLARMNDYVNRVSIQIARFQAPRV